MELESHRRQKISEGYGARFHRVYSIRFPGGEEAARAGMRALQVDLNRCSPQLLARFEKLGGPKDQLTEGDEFQIHITGPWNGPVRVAQVCEQSFRLVTLEGHLEAGEIEFRVGMTEEGYGELTIESVARSRDALVDFAYDKIPVAKLAQTEMWKIFCKTFAEMAVDAVGADPASIGPVEVMTERCEEGTGEWVRV